MTITKPLVVIFIALLSFACAATKGEEQQSGLDGSWEALKFTTDPGTPYSTFHLKLRTSGHELAGKYCFITQSGNKIDCDPESGDNITGKIESGAVIAYVTFHSYFGARDGKARIDLKDESLYWKVESMPTGGEFYGPKSSIMHRSK